MAAVTSDAFISAVILNSAAVIAAAVISAAKDGRIRGLWDSL